MCRRRLWLALCLTLLSAGMPAADPMRPDNRSEPEPANRPAPAPEPRLTLDSVYILADQRYAVINGQWLALNDNIHNYRVVAIGPDRVSLRRGDHVRTLDRTQAGDLSITATDED